MSDLISRQAAIDALNGIINRFEQILRDIRESKVDDSVCGMCEYDGAFVGQSGDWCNECPGFEKDDCFKLSDKTRKEWAEEIIKALTPIQPEQLDTNLAEVGTDAVSRKAVKELAYSQIRSMYCGVALKEQREAMLMIANNVIGLLAPVASTQPEIVRCKNCKYWHSGSCEYPEHIVNSQDFYVGDIETEAEHFCGYAERREENNESN